MRSVGVFCSSSDSISPVFLEEARLLGELLAKNSFRLVYGGARTGAMGALAEGALTAGGKVLGIFPQLELGHEKAHEGLTEFINVQTMAERKQILFDKSEAFLVFPGGLGTLDEIFELITLRLLHEASPNKNLNMHKKSVIFVNTLNFWDPLFECLEIMIQQGFISRPLGQLFQVKEDLKEIVQFLANK